MRSQPCPNCLWYGGNYGCDKCRPPYDCRKSKCPLCGGDLHFKRDHCDGSTGFFYACGHHALLTMGEPDIQKQAPNPEPEEKE